MTLDACKTTKENSERKVGGPCLASQCNREKIWKSPLLNGETPMKGGEGVRGGGDQDGRGQVTYGDVALRVLEDVGDVCRS